MANVLGFTGDKLLYTEPLPYYGPNDVTRYHTMQFTNRYGQKYLTIVLEGEEELFKREYENGVYDHLEADVIVEKFRRKAMKDDIDNMIRTRKIETEKYQTEEDIFEEKLVKGFRIILGIGISLVAAYILRNYS